MYLVTVAWLTSMPGFNDSPWMRGAPHNGLSRLVRWLSSRISCEVRGRGGFPWQDFHFQNRPNPWRCQPMTVSGSTMTRASFQRRHRRERKTQNRRSSGRSHGRGLSRFRTATRWRRAMFSSCNVARLRTISRTQATRITTIVCMLQTVAGSGLKCQDSCGQRGFEERQADEIFRRHREIRSPRVRLRKQVRVSRGNSVQERHPLMERPRFRAHSQERVPALRSRGRSGLSENLPSSQTHCVPKSADPPIRVCPPA